MEIRFAHIINTIAKEDNPSLFAIQELTAETMRRAKDHTKGIQVDLLSAQFSNARASLPTGFRSTADLTVCAADKKELGTAKRLPLLSEILQRLRESESATHFIYTNADICVMPFFYETAERYIRKGHDAIVINRRRISSAFTSADDLAEAYGEAGMTHTGYDCFVFSRALLDKFIMREIFIGTPPAGNDLFYNLFTFANDPVLLPEKHLTFHSGMDLYKAWGDPALNRKNQKEFMILLRELRPLMDISKFPGAGYFILKRHFKWLMNPTFHYPTMAIVDLKQLGKKRRSPAKRETRGFKSRYLQWIVNNASFRDGD